MNTLMLTLEGRERTSQQRKTRHKGGDGTLDAKRETQKEEL